MRLAARRELARTLRWLRGQRGYAERYLYPRVLAHLAHGESLRAVGVRYGVDRNRIAALRDRALAELDRRPPGV